MYDVNLIKSGLLGLVGWRQNEDIAGWQLTEMLTSESGLYYNGVHPLLTVDNLISLTAEYDRLYNTQGEINTAFTNWLKERTEEGITQTIEDWINAKFENQTARNLLEREKLFVSTGDFDDLELSAGKVVGMEIVPNRARSILTKITKLGVQFDTNQTIEIKLFKTGTKAPIQTQSVVYIGNGSVQWADVDWSLKGEGAYYVAYDQNLLNGNAINGVRDYTWRNRGLTSYPTGRYFKATAFSSTAANAVELWDIKTNNYTIDTNYGLNICLHVGCDYTDFILEQKRLFATAISLQVGINLLRELAFNAQARVNRNESNIDRSQVLYEIDGDTQGNNESTLHGRLKKAIKGISFDQTGIEKICLPCRKRGVKYGSIGPST